MASGSICRLATTIRTTGYGTDPQVRDRLALSPLPPRSIWGKKTRIVSRICLVALAAAVFILAATATYSAQEKGLVERRKLSKEDEAVIGAMKLRAIFRLVKIPGRELRFQD